MDPLLVIASTVAIAVALSTSLDQFKTLYDAGHELHAVMNEVSEIRIVLLEVESAIMERQSRKQLPQRSVESICKLVVCAKDKLQLLDSITKDRLIQSYSPSGEAKVARLAWLRQKSKVKKL
jgi:hypothetical protein